LNESMRRVSQAPADSRLRTTGQLAPSIPLAATLRWKFLTATDDLSSLFSAVRTGSLALAAVGFRGRFDRQVLVKSNGNPGVHRSSRLLLDVSCELWYYICILVMEVPVESAITVKGQATIPKAIREHLGLKPGDRVKFFVHPDGSVVLLPKLSASSLRGIIKSRRRRPVTIAEMTEAVVEGAARVASPTTRR
jgi:antitoxin PrlF